MDSPTVLLIDDDVNILHGLTRALRRQPYRFLTARSAEEAMLILKQWQIDVIVCDEQLPGMRGSDLLVWAARHIPDVARIVLTGRPDVETALKAINEGRVFRFFTKPCNEIDLAIAIGEAIEVRRKSQRSQTSESAATAAAP